jgi:hypothetical protein
MRVYSWDGVYSWDEGILCGMRVYSWGMMGILMWDGIDGSKGGVYFVLDGMYDGRHIIISTMEG